MRHKDINWNIPETSSAFFSIEHATLAVLMDIRDELKTLNASSDLIRSNTLSVKSTLSCANFLNIPSKLDAIRRNTVKPRKLKAKRKK